MRPEKFKKPQNEPMRVSGAQRREWPVLDGERRTAAVLGAPYAVVKALRLGGSRAFLTGGRVDTGILVPEIIAALVKGSNLPPGVSTPQDWLALEKAQREKIKREVEEGQMMESAEAQRQAGEAWGFVFSELERRDRELPPALAGLSAVEIGKRMTSDTEKIRKGAKVKFDEVGK